MATEQQTPTTDTAPTAAPAGDATGERRGGRGGNRGGGAGFGGPGGGNRGPGGGNNRGPGGPGGDNRGPRRDNTGDRNNTGEELIEKLVTINRVAKVVKGGKRFGFAALVIVGDGKGRVGYGAGKAREVPEAISKATTAARRSLVRISLRENRTIHHDVHGIFGAGEVVLRAAPSGTGIIAGGPMRAVFEAVGMHDVVAKSVGSSNPHNMVKATFAALQSASSPRAVAARRGKKVTDLHLGKQAKEYGSTPSNDAAPESEEA